jgi:hypothetical protein
MVIYIRIRFLYITTDCILSVQAVADDYRVRLYFTDASLNQALAFRCSGAVPDLTEPVGELVESTVAAYNVRSCFPFVASKSIHSLVVPHCSASHVGRIINKIIDTTSMMCMQPRRTQHKTVTRFLTHELFPFFLNAPLNLNNNNNNRSDHPTPHIRRRRLSRAHRHPASPWTSLRTPAYPAQSRKNSMVETLPSRLGRVEHRLRCIHGPASTRRCVRHTTHHRGLLLPLCNNHHLYRWRRGRGRPNSRCQSRDGVAYVP